MAVFFNTMFMNSGLASIINIVQEFTITITAGNLGNTATLATSVDTTKCGIMWSGQTSNTITSGTMARAKVRVTLTNGTTVTAARGTTTDDVVVYGSVIEFKSAACVSAQNGFIALGSGVTSNTATISSVSTSNAFVLYGGVNTTSTGNTMTRVYSSLDLTNATTVTATRSNGTSSTTNVSYCVVELTPGIIKSVQKIAATQATTGTTLDATISAVTTANTAVFWNGMTTALGTGDSESSTYYYDLTSTTNVQFTRVGTNTTTRTLYATAVEFNPGYVKYRATGLPAFTASDTQIDTSITAVNLSKSILNYRGNAPTTLLAPEAGFTGVATTSTTNVRAYRNTASGAVTASFELLEFN